ncbi:hypothetical protein CUMW_230960 [Citrus unshiu]|uniref:Trafficking protein particle complex subunit n=1 Tax=Citrus unshiu TaxID=55188 RepID=A0A2H5QHJ3_CITUN|nr:hypothetical protein CUMW_230960 [Citrus unshiu]
MLLYNYWCVLKSKRALEPEELSKPEKSATSPPLPFAGAIAAASVETSIHRRRERYRSAEKENLGLPLLPGQDCSFHSSHTHTYKLCFMIILVTHARTGGQHELLKCIYNLYVESIDKNPLYSPGTRIRSLVTINRK